MLTELYDTKEDYEELDKHLEFIPITYDSMFKSVFLKNKEILKKFILSLLDESEDVKELRNKCYRRRSR